MIKGPDCLGLAQHVDHIVPVAMGGTDDDTNLQSACSVCNQGKGARPLDEYLGRARRRLRLPRRIPLTLIGRWTLRHAWAVATVLVIAAAAVVVHKVSGAPLSLTIIGLALLWAWTTPPGTITGIMRRHRFALEASAAVFSLFAVLTLAMPGVLVAPAAVLTAGGARSRNLRQRITARRDRLRHREQWRVACLATGLAKEPTYGPRPRQDPVTDAVGALFKQRGPQTSPGKPGPTLVHAQPGRRGALTLHVQLRGDLVLTDLQRAAEGLATHYGARDATVTTDPDNVSRARVVIAAGPDPLTTGKPIPWPGFHKPGPRSMWDPIPVGIDDRGEEVTLRLHESTLLIAGLPGGGKSVAMSLVLAHAVRDPLCDVVILDAKGGLEAEPWRPVCRQVVEDLDDALVLLRGLRADLKDRMAALKAGSRRKARPGDPMQLIVVDELAEFLNGPGSKKDRDEFLSPLRSIVQLGRALGVMVMAATQRPSATIVPTSLRDVFSLRWGLRAATATSSNMVLGEYAAQGYDCSTIPVKRKASATSSRRGISRAGCGPTC